jgi:hypothetical protein
MHDFLFFVLFFPSPLKFGVMENVVEFYKKIKKLHLHYKKKHNMKGIFNEHQ